MDGMNPVAPPTNSNRHDDAGARPQRRPTPDIASHETGINDMSYTCPDCDDGVLVAKVREIEIADDETAELVDGRVQVTSVRCNNGCSPDDEEEAPKPRKKKKAPAAAEPGQCPRSEICSKGPGHTGRCNSLLATREA